MMEQISLTVSNEISAEAVAYKQIEPTLIETMHNAATPANTLIFSLKQTVLNIVHYILGMKIIWFAASVSAAKKAMLLSQSSMSK